MTPIPTSHMHVVDIPPAPDAVTVNPLQPVIGAIVDVVNEAYNSAEHWPADYGRELMLLADLAPALGLPVASLLGARVAAWLETVAG